MKKRVLVLDGDMASALAIVRALGRQGWPVDIASPEKHGIAAQSKFPQRKWIYPNPLQDEAAFLNWTSETIKNPDYALVIPVTERTLVPLMKIRDTEGAEKLAMAANESLETVLDKTKTEVLAKSLNIPIPKSFHLTSKSEIEPFLTSEEFTSLLQPGCPAVIKPGRSIGKNKSGRKKLEVQYAFNRDEAQNRIEALLNFGEVSVQEYFTGNGTGVEVLAQNGVIQYAFQHERIHELPLTGGASCLRRSVPLNEDLLSATTKIIRALNWTGVAMVEFKWNPTTQNFVLVEINGRFWGSLPLAIAAGADFPSMLCELLVSGAVKPRPTYTPHVYARNLSKDLEWYQMVLRNQTPSGFKGAWENKRKFFIDALRVFTPKHHFDIQEWTDMGPGLVDLLGIIKSHISRITSIIENMRSLRFHKRQWARGTAQDTIAKSNSLLFVCLGNINRSALAERYFKQTFPDSPVIVNSCGFYHQDGRPADPIMVQEAHSLGIDMSSWSSSTLTEEMLKTHDAILVMEHSHWLKIMTEYPSYVHKTFLLGCAASHETMKANIDDPYGRPREHYRQCLRHVCTSVDTLVTIVKKAH